MIHISDSNMKHEQVEARSNYDLIPNNMLESVQICMGAEQERRSMNWVP